MKWDFFISHASEDKDAIARKLADGLKNEGFRVWFDEFTLTLGDSLRRSIDQGLSESKFGIVILSDNFFSKDWPQKELDALVSKERNGIKIILPVWHKIRHDEIVKYSPLLADRLGVNTDKGLDHVIHEIRRAYAGVLRADGNITRSGDNKNGPQKNQLSDDLLISANNDLLQISWQEEQAYKQSIIYPTEGKISIAPRQLKQIINRNTVKLEGYNGPSFPCNSANFKTDEIRHADGFAIYDKEMWKKDKWRFFYWCFNSNLEMLHRKGFVEEVRDDLPKDGMVLQWILLDITEPLRFAKNLLSQFAEIDEINTEIKWFGIKNRRLIIIDDGLIGYPMGYDKLNLCKNNRIELTQSINRDTDLSLACYTHLDNIMWQFGWDNYDDNRIKSHISSIINGKFPKTKH